MNSNVYFSRRNMNSNVYFSRRNFKVLKYIAREPPTSVMLVIEGGFNIQKFS